MTRPRILVAGIGGASLGTEIAKCLAMAGHYRVVGCDISPHAYGLYDPLFDETFLVERADYVRSVLEGCLSRGIQAIVPGGEQPSALLSSASDQFESRGILLAINSPAVVTLFSDKSASLASMASWGIKVPRTDSLSRDADFGRLPYPCVIKPARGSGGSTSVFLTSGEEEARNVVHQMISSGSEAIAQEYLPDEEGEFTVGVLHLPDGRLAGSIALRRVLQPKLSHIYRGERGVISSGYSQGLIDDFADVRHTAERIATLARSRGPFNVQGRVRNGEFIPFEVNARFSASTYLRSLAGFNEVDVFLQFLLNGSEPKTLTLRPGYYFRSLTERYVPLPAIKT